MVSNIGQLPNEVLYQIALHLPPTSLPVFQRVCCRFDQLVDNLIWRKLCATRFKYWDSRHRIKAKLAGESNDIDWKILFIQRHLVDRSTSDALNSILSSQQDRLDKFQQIISHGYDAKDCLMRHFQVADSADDVLARRYYSDAVLGCLHRIMAIEEWSKLKRRENVTLERALAAFDLFVLKDREGDFDEIALSLDRITQEIRIYCETFDEKTTRQKSSIIVSYLRTQNLIGCAENSSYYDLQNSFIGIALHSEEHNSTPLISAAIYCSVAQKLGINAATCELPFHVFVVVKPRDGFDLDERPCQSGPAPPMYMDPFTSGEELSKETLVTRLVAVGTARASFGDFLAVSSIENVVIRCGRNILNAIQQFNQQTTERNGHGGSDRSATMVPYPDYESAFYSALWASLILGVPPGGDGPMLAMRRRNYLPHIVEHFETHFPTDIGLIEKYIVPLFRNTGEYAQLRESIRVMRSVDSMPKQPKRRTTEISQRVRYRVGQVFTHRRYHYVGVITGWDIECGADEQWKAHMRVHELSRGPLQSFYHVLVEDKSVRYVAEENIDVEEPGIPHSLMCLAGRHFKRWDKQNRCFVSNIKDEYPDD